MAWGYNASFTIVRVDRYENGKRQPEKKSANGEEYAVSAKRQQIDDCKKEIADAAARMQMLKATILRLPNLTGKSVVHCELGTGTVTCCKDDRITVDYHGIVRTYQYDLAFAQGTLTCKGCKTQLFEQNARTNQEIKRLTEYIRRKQSELEHLTQD